MLIKRLDAAQRIVSSEGVTPCSFMAFSASEKQKAYILARLVMYLAIACFCSGGITAGSGDGSNLGLEVATPSDWGLSVGADGGMSVSSLLLSKRKFALIPGLNLVY